MKKTTITLMMFALMLLLAACGGNDNTKTDTPVDNGTNDTEEVAEDTEGEEEAAGEDTGTVEVTHEYDENPVIVEKNPETVVVFDFGMLDTLDELGVEIAGVPQQNIPSYLEKYADENYANVGSLKEPDFEAIHALNPDVIFISGRQTDMYEELSEIAPTVFVGVDNANYMESFKNNMNMVAEIFGKEDEMKAELEEIDSQVAEINEKTAANEDKTLIMLGTEGKMSAYGPSSRFGIIHDVFGFKPADENIEVSTHGQNISFEYILETNPGILFVIDRDAAIGGDASVKDSLENDLVQKTDAFKNDKIIYLNADYWYLSGGGLQSVKEMIKEVEAAL